MTLADLRRAAYRQALFPQTTLPEVFGQLPYVQIDPITAPAKAQDLILFQRVRDYRAGDAEDQYQGLPVVEDYYMNYGYISRDILPLIYPRTPTRPWSVEGEAGDMLEPVYDFICENGPTQSKDVISEFGKRQVANYWGGKGQAATKVLDYLHYLGRLGVSHRQSGKKFYHAVEHDHEPLAVEDQVLGSLRLLADIYGPVPLKGMWYLIRHTAWFGGPQCFGYIMKNKRILGELEQVTLDGVTYALPPTRRADEPLDQVRIVAPFDPLVYDRSRFEQLYGWEYRFEAYTPAPKRTMGYYALPLFWRDDCVGWANLSVVAGKLEADIRYVREPKEKAFRAELDLELDRFRFFLRAN